MTHRGLLELSTFESVHYVIIASLNHLNECDHFLVLHQIVRSGAEQEWVSIDEPLNLFLHSADHGLVEVAVRPIFVGVRLYGRDVRPASLWLGISNDEICKAHEGYGGRVEDGCEE